MAGATLVPTAALSLRVVSQSTNLFLLPICSVALSADVWPYIVIWWFSEKWPP